MSGFKVGDRVKAVYEENVVFGVVEFALGEVLGVGVGWRAFPLDIDTALWDVEVLPDEPAVPDAPGVWVDRDGGRWLASEVDGRLTCSMMLFAYEQSELGEYAPFRRGS